MVNAPWHYVRAASRSSACRGAASRRALRPESNVFARPRKVVGLFRRRGVRGNERPGKLPEKPSASLNARTFASWPHAIFEETHGPDGARPEASLGGRSRKEWGRRGGAPAFSDAAAQRPDRAGRGSCHGRTLSPVVELQPYPSVGRRMIVGRPRAREKGSDPPRTTERVRSFLVIRGIGQKSFDM